MEISVDSIESIALGLTASKACVAINKGKSIKGFHLVYA
jgi:hypothetical protein